MVVKQNEIIKKIPMFITVGDKLAVAVSGGMDSMVLLHAVKKSDILKSENLLAVNIEHGIRGEASRADSAFVESYCRDNGISFKGFSVDAVGYSAEKGLTLEEGARELRRGIFLKLLSEGVCDKVALAHHRADQAETVLMRVIRGTGISGLVGMRAADGKIIRPLLDVSKREIEDYQRIYKVPYIVDESNFDDNFTRNKLRNEILPALESLSQDAEAGLVRLSRIAAETEDFLSACDNPVDVFCSRAEIRIISDEHKLLFKRRARRCFEALGAAKDIEERHLELICGLTALENGASLDMPYDIKVTREYDRIVFTKAFSQDNGFSTPFFIGKVAIGTNVFDIAKYNGEPLNKGELIFDLDKIPETAVFRFRREGDRFTKFGGGTKSLGDYLTDKKIPLRIRDNLTLCADGGDVLFIAGVEISDSVKRDKNSNNEKIYKITSEAF